MRKFKVIKQHYDIVPDTIVVYEIEDHVLTALSGEGQILVRIVNHPHGDESFRSIPLSKLEELVCQMPN